MPERRSLNVLETSRKTKTNWRERAQAFFRDHGADVDEEETGNPSLGFHIGQGNGQRQGYIKNPCPSCIGGRLFPDWDRATHQWHMKCLCCGRLALKENGMAYTVAEWDRRCNGNRGGRPKTETEIMKKRA
jgi:hypothetical protein